MDVTIIGSGNMARAIGTRLAAAKHTLSIHDRDEGKARALAQDLGGNAAGHGLGHAIAGEVVICALPYTAIPDVLRMYISQLPGKVLVDISNPIDFQTFELLLPPDSSGAQEIAKLLPPDTKLVKAFNTTFAGTLLAGEVDGKKLDVFVAADDAGAAQTVLSLAESSGLRGLYVGQLAKARILEGMQLIHISLQQKLGTNWMSTVKILP